MRKASSRAARAPLVALGAAGLAAAVLAGCSTDKIVEVDQPDIVLPENLNTVTALPANLAAAQSDFQVAFSGSSGSEGQVNYSGLLADELINTETFPTRIEIDRRSVQDDNSNNDAIYRSLATARQSTERTARLYAQLLPQRSTLADTNNFDNGRAEALALAGYTYILFGENYCAPIPFTEVDSASQVIPAAPVPQDSVWRRALARFDTAAALAAGTITRNTSAAAVAQATNILRLVRVGRARTYLDRANDDVASAYLDSATAAISNVIAGTSGVPTTYRYQVFASENSGRQNNGIWSFTVGGLRWGIANRQGTNGLPYRTNYTASQAAGQVVDNRTGFGAAVRGFDGLSSLFRPQKYPLRTSPTTLADGVEARLVEAEAALRKGNTQQFLDLHNALRSNINLPQLQCVTGETACVAPNPTAVLPALTDQGSLKANADVHFRERAYWLFLTAHRLGDMRREVRQLGSAGYTVATVFPVGTYEKPGQNSQYGGDVSFPIPVFERSNTSFPQQAGPTCDNTAP